VGLIEVKPRGAGEATLVPMKKSLGRQPRHEQRHEQRRAAPGKDPYRPLRKPAGATRCTDCGAVFHRGRWTWRVTPQHAASGLCPACRRIRERLPAGFLRLTGAFAREQREELVRRARHCEAQERAEHPLQRIMAIEPLDGGLLLTTTDSHLARRIGEALRDAYQGELHYHYTRGERLLRVTWSR
jgi:NMD protein affecting ribosome stability and mRNA decay